MLLCLITDWNYVVIEKIKCFRTVVLFENGLSQVKSNCCCLFLATMYLVRRHLVYRSFVGSPIQVRSCLRCAGDFWCWESLIWLEIRQNIFHQSTNPLLYRHYYTGYQLPLCCWFVWKYYLHYCVSIPCILSRKVVAQNSMKIID